MTRTERIAQLEADITAQGWKVTQEVARLRAMQAELASIQAGVALTGDLAGLERTEAVLAVLHDGGAMLSPKEIEQRLEAGGRSDTYRTITATLDHLMKQNKVTRADRGHYLAL